MDDLISRQAAIDAADRADYTGIAVEDVKKVTDEVVKELKKLPSAQPVNYGSTNLIDRQATLYGYNIEHLAMIANVMREKNVTPEKVIEILTDVGQVVAICHAEFEESLRKAVERCWT